MKHLQRLDMNVTISDQVQVRPSSLSGEAILGAIDAMLRTIGLDALEKDTSNFGANPRGGVPSMRGLYQVCSQLIIPNKLITTQNRVAATMLELELGLTSK
jgi:hypothetical protein